MRLKSRSEKNRNVKKVQNIRVTASPLLCIGSKKLVQQTEARAEISLYGQVFNAEFDSPSSAIPFTSLALHHVLLSVIITPAFAKLQRANRLPVTRYMARVRDANIMRVAHKNLHCGRYTSGLALPARYGKSSARVAAFIAKSVMSHSAAADPLPSTRRRRVATRWKTRVIDRSREASANVTGRGKIKNNSDVK